MFPGTPTAPPIMVTDRILALSAARPRRRTAASSVGGPSVNTSTRPGADWSAARNTRSPDPAGGRAGLAGRGSPQRLSAASRHPFGKACVPFSGRGRPQPTGMSGLPASAASESAFVAPLGQRASPSPSTTIAVTSTSARRSRYRSAIASEASMSVSTMTLRGTALAVAGAPVVVPAAAPKATVSANSNRDDRIISP